MNARLFLIFSVESRCYRDCLPLFRLILSALYINARSVAAIGCVYALEQAQLGAKALATDVIVRPVSFNTK